MISRHLLRRQVFLSNEAEHGMDYCKQINCAKSGMDEIERQTIQKDVRIFPTKIVSDLTIFNGGNPENPYIETPGGAGRQRFAAWKNLLQAKRTGKSAVLVPKNAISCHVGRRMASTPCRSPVTGLAVDFDSHVPSPSAVATPIDRTHVCGLTCAGPKTG